MDRPFEARVSDAGVRMLFDALDIDRSGTICFDELHAFMKKARKEVQEMEGLMWTPEEAWWKGYLMLPTLTGITCWAAFAPLQQAMEKIFAMSNVDPNVMLSNLSTYDTVVGLLYAIILGTSYQSLANKQDQLFEALMAEISEVRALLFDLSLGFHDNSRLPHLLALPDQYLQLIMDSHDGGSEKAYSLVTRRDREALDMIVKEAAALESGSTGHYDIRERVDRIRRLRTERVAKSRVELPAVHWIGIRMPAILIAASFVFVPSNLESLGQLNGACWSLLCAMFVAMDLIVDDLSNFYEGAYNVQKPVDEMIKAVSKDVVEAIQDSICASIGCSIQE